MKKIVRFSLWSLLIVFAAMNFIAAMHAYKFTHYSKKGIKTDRLQLSTAKKLALLFTGVDNPRPKNTIIPQHPYSTVIVKSNLEIECWEIPALKEHKGTVILFHGYTSCKSALIDRAEGFLQNGYNCLLVDFMGSGGSGGNRTTVGFTEAQEVADCYKYLQQKGEKNIYLYGSSMGAVAIMKAINDAHIKPKAIILECPFATMRETIGIRFHKLGVPTFPMADLLLFWGGALNKFWAFSHNPVEYAKNIDCPTLVQYGEQDDRVARDEIERIYTNIAFPKNIITYPEAGHDDYIKKYGIFWSRNMVQFLDAYQ